MTAEDTTRRTATGTRAQDTTATATGADVLNLIDELSSIYRPTWPALRRDARASGLVCEGEGDPPAGDPPKTEPAGDPPKTDPPKAAGEDDDLLEEGEKDLPDHVKKILKENRKTLREETAGRKAAEEKVSEFEAAGRSDLENITLERDNLKTENGKLTGENLRLRVALEKKLPAELIDRLKGDTKEAIAADADELLKLVKTPGGKTPDYDAGVRQTAPSGTSMNDLLRDRIAARRG